VSAVRLGNVIAGAAKPDPRLALGVGRGNERGSSDLHVRGQPRGDYTGIGWACRPQHTQLHLQDSFPRSSAHMAISALSEATKRSKS
jgi:hypothetical protein